MRRRVRSVTSFSDFLCGLCQGKDSVDLGVRFFYLTRFFFFCPIIKV